MDQHRVRTLRCGQLPSFHFKVTLGSVGEISFSEVSGLETEFEEITYRAGDSNDFTNVEDARAEESE